MEHTINALKESVLILAKETGWSNRIETLLSEAKRQERISTFSTDELIDMIPQNKPLYKDSGLWEVRSEDMQEIVLQQECNESFRDFLCRYISKYR